MRSRRIFPIVLSLALLCRAALAQDLGSLKAVPGLRPGSVLVLELTGDAGGGSVWGTGLYTADSSLAAAAVHSGVLGNRQRGVVVVEVLPGQPSYTGSASRGVTSLSWGSYGLSFRFLSQLPAAESLGSGGSAQGPAAAPLPPQRIYGFDDPAILGKLKPTPGSLCYFRLTGSTAGNVWGSGPYTLDSALPAAVVHAGLLAPGQTGLVRLTVLPGQSSYAGSARNGVTSASWGSYGASYSVERVSGEAQFQPVIADPGAPNQLKDAVPGAIFAVWVLGSAAGGRVWGSGVYTADSSLAAAAVHAGLLPDGGSGAVLVRVLPGQSSYVGTSANGVTTVGYGSYGLSFSLEALR